MMQFIICLWALILIQLHPNEKCTIASGTKDYIDLGDLRDNDEVHWINIYMPAENINSNKYTEFLIQHNYRQRRTTENGDSGILPENKGYGTCRTPTGDEGNCRHIIYCRIPELTNDVWRLVSHLCVIEKSSIGICCPNRIVTRFGPQIIVDANTNDLSQPAMDSHPEERGCGVVTKQFPRIISGRPAESDEWPWMAAVLKRGLPYVWCGGVLLTDRHVLTAAHCIHKTQKDDLFVRLGEYNTLQLNETRARDFRVGAMLTHIDYDPLTYENDIALIRVLRPTIFNSYIWPICMPPFGQDWEDKDGVITGWGSKNFGGPHADVLMEVSLPIWKQDDCREAILERIPDTMLCAGFPDGGQDSCQGDSGGPLMIQLANRRWVIVGIVSWGVRCGEPNRPGMYTRVDRYFHWILQNCDI